MSDVRKMLQHAVPDGNLPEIRPVCLCKSAGVPICPVCSAEAGHGNGVNPMMGQSQPVICHNGDDQRQGGIQSPGQTDHHVLAMDMPQPGHKPYRLHLQDLAAPIIQLTFPGGHKGRCRELPLQPGLPEGVVKEFLRKSGIRC